MDDLIVTKTDQAYLYVVSNAGCADKDSAHMKVNAGGCGVRVIEHKMCLGVSDVEECVCACVCHLQAKLAEFKAAGFDVDLEFLDAALIALQGKTFTSLLHLTAFSFFLSSLLS